jgi:hypothetical protein
VAGLIRRPSAPPNPEDRGFQRIPSRMGGATPEQQSSVFHGFYGEMPMPATQFTTSVARLQSLNIEPSVKTDFANASLVDRRDRMKGYHPTAGRQSFVALTPQINKPVMSSQFQKWLIGPQVNYILNACLFRAGFPAATISQGTDRNMGLSERTPQLPTRTSGGPGPATMTPAPRFRSVQQVPRYSTFPSMYPTQGQ